MQTTKLLDRFHKWLLGRDGMQVLPATAGKYLRVARKFVAEYGHPANVPSHLIAKWTKEIEVIRDGEEIRPASASSINVSISAIKALFRYVQEAGLRKDNPVEHLSLSRVPKRKPRPVSRDVLKQTYENVATNPDPLALQDLAILEVLYGSGPRRDEAGRLTLQDVVDRRYLRIIGKGDKERITILPSVAYNALRDWCLHAHGDERTIQLQEEISADAAFDDLQKRFPDKGIFVTEQGRPVNTLRDPGHFIWRRMRPYLSEAGVTPHQLRHTFATHLLGNKTSPYLVGLLLGHEDMNTVKIYAGADPEAFSDVRHAHPRSKEQFYVSVD